MKNICVVFLFSIIQFGCYSQELKLNKLIFKNVEFCSSLETIDDVKFIEFSDFENIENFNCISSIVYFPVLKKIKENTKRSNVFLPIRSKKEEQELKKIPVKIFVTNVHFKSKEADTNFFRETFYYKADRCKLKKVDSIKSISFYQSKKNMIFVLREDNGNLNSVFYFFVINTTKLKGNEFRYILGSGVFYFNIELTVGSLMDFGIGGSKPLPYMSPSFNNTLK